MLQTKLYLWIVFGYLLGSCPTGYVLVRIFRGEDIRHFGSGNIGATNVARVLGRKWSIFTAVFDMFKGGIAIVIAMAAGVADARLLALVGCASVIGHDYPVWIGFKGGKGVATTFGVLGCYHFFSPLPAILGGVVWFCVRELTGYVSIASILGLAAGTVLTYCWKMPLPYTYAAAFLTLLTIWRHRQNIERLAAGTENKTKPLFIKR